MKIIIVGGGKTGLALTNLLGDAYDITIIESDEKIFSIAQEKGSIIIIDKTKIRIRKVVS